MPFPFIPVIIGAAVVAGVGVLLASKKSSKKKKGRIGKDKGPKDDDDEIIELGTIQERLYKHSQEHENRTRFFFSRYTKWGKNQTVFSARILKLKEMDEGVIDDFALKFKFLKGLENLAIIRVPSHAKDKSNGMELLAKLISEKYGVSDLSHTFLRVSDVSERKQKQRDNRHMSEKEKTTTRASLRIKEPQLLKGKDILLLDDIATSWDTIKCCEFVIERDATPKSIYSLVLGRTQPSRK